MKNSSIVLVGILTLMASVLSSCEAIMGIFKAGMGFGAFAVIAVILLIIYGFTRIGKSKNG